MTTSLDDDLRAAFARQAERVAVDPAAAFGDRPVRLSLEAPYQPAHAWRPIVASAAATVTAVGGLLFVATRQEPSGTAAPVASAPDLLEPPATTDALPAPTTAPASGPRLLWGTPSLVPDPQGLFLSEDVTDRAEVAGVTNTFISAVEVKRVIPFGDGYLAAGTESVGAHHFGVIWRSDDGVAWQRVESTAFDTEPIVTPSDEYGTELSGLVSDGERIVAVGTIRADGVTVPAAWTSVDGEVWTQQPLDAPPLPVAAPLIDVVVTSAGFTAATFDIFEPNAATPTGSVVLRSSDGASWETLPGPAAATPGARITGITTVGDRIVAFGHTGGGRGTPATWHSDDGGATWSAATLPAVGELPITAPLFASAAADGVLLVGYNATENPYTTTLESGLIELHGSTQPVAWWSADGVDFELVDTSAINTGFDVVADAATTPTGVLLATRRLEPTGDSRLLWEWTPAGGFTPVDTHGVDLNDLGRLFPIDGGYLGVDLKPRESSFDGPGRTDLWVIPAAPEPAP